MYGFCGECCCMVSIIQFGMISRIPQPGGKGQSIPAALRPSPNSCRCAHDAIYRRRLSRISSSPNRRRTCASDRPSRRRSTSTATIQTPSKALLSILRLDFRSACNQALAPPSPWRIAHICGPALRLGPEGQRTGARAERLFGTAVGPRLASRNGQNPGGLRG